MDLPDGATTTRPLCLSGAEPQRSVLDRADAILAAFDREHTDLSLLGIMARTGLPKTTVHRSVHKMVDLDWLEVQDGRYSIGARMLEFTALTWANAVLREAAMPVLQRLRTHTRQTIHLAVGTGSSIVYIEKLPGRTPVAGVTRIGARLPAHCTGLGKVILAFAHRDRAHPEQLEARTRHTIVSPRTLTGELHRIQDEGIAYDRQEFALGLECIAAPLHRPDGACPAAISISVAAHRTHLRTFAPDLREAAVTVSRAL